MTLKRPAFLSRRRFYFLLGALIGAAAFLLIYGPSTLNVQYDSWIYAGYMEQDILQRYGGWLWYRQAPFTFPLSVAGNYAQPYGGCITFNDSLPLVALVCKLFSPLLPDTFQYFGWVNFLNFILQGGFAALLLRRFKTGPLFAAGGAVLFVLLPPFVERVFRHDSLACHWMILAALWLYFTARDGAHLARDKAAFPTWGFVLLCGLAIGLHTYYLPMVWAILLAALLESGARGFSAGKKAFAPALSWGRPLLTLVLCAGATLVSAGAFGLLTRGGGGEAAGFGDYSLNLTALWAPQSFDWYAPDEAFQWSALLPAQPRFHHQYDGFMYLGAGLLLALAAMVVYGIVRAVTALARKDKAPFRKAAAFLKGHVWLLLACLCLSLFAVSHIVTWGETILFTLPLPQSVLNLFAIFRASGRMFWPCLYLLVLAILVFLARLPKAPLRYGALVAVLALQLYDLAPALRQKHDYFAKGPIVVEDQFTTEGWRFLTQNYSTATCLNGLYDYELFLNLIRCNPAMQSNIIAMNRGHYPLILDACIPRIEELAAGAPLAEGEMAILKDDYVFYDVVRGMHPDLRGYISGDYYILAKPRPGCPLPEYLPGVDYEAETQVNAE